MYFDMKTLFDSLVRSGGIDFLSPGTDWWYCYLITWSRFYFDTVIWSSDVTICVYLCVVISLHYHGIILKVLFYLLLVTVCVYLGTVISLRYHGIIVKLLSDLLLLLLCIFFFVITLIVMILFVQLPGATVICVFPAKLWFFFTSSTIFLKSSGTLPSDT